jgi:hypothetical protein
LPSDELQTYWERKPSFYIEAFTDADWLIVQNLQLRQAGYVFGGKPWPASYLAVGNDGCGNTYCIDAAANCAAPVLMFEHDPKNAFIEAAPSWAEFTANWRQIPRKDTGESEAETGPLTITRAPIPWKGVLYPIPLDEWTRYVSSDPEMQLLGYRELINPFTGKVAGRIDSPGYAVWKTNGKVAAVYKFGCITMEGEDADKVKKMKQIAKALNASLSDDRGNTC